MAIKFNTFPSSVNTTTGDLQVKNGSNLAETEVEYNENGEYTIEAPDGYYGLSKVTVTVDASGGEVNNQDKTVNPTTSSQTVEADSGYTGLGTVTVTAVDSTIDQNILSTNIKKDVTILGITGSYTGDPRLQSKNATPTTSSQTISPDGGYDGLSEVTVAAVTSSIDANIQAGNIKSGVTILGVQGTVQEGITPTGNINITDTNSTDVTNYATAQVVDANLAAGNIKSGVTILGISGSYNPQPDLQSKTVSPTTSQQTVTPDQGKDGLSSVTVNAVTAAIDANIQAANILDGVTILGVTGTDQGYDVGYNTGYAEGQADCPEPSLDTLTVTPSTSQQIIDPDPGYEGFDQVTVGAVTSSIDQNITAGNIKDGVTILGVTGTYTGGGGAGCAYPDWSTIGWTCTDVQHSGLDEELTATAQLSTYVNNTDVIFAPKTVSQTPASGGLGPFSGCTNLKFTPDLITVTGDGTGTSYRYMFQNCSKITKANVNRSATTNNIALGMFVGCSNLEEVNVDMTGITDMSNLFSSCSKLKSNGVHFTNQSGVTTMSSIFNGCEGTSTDGFVVPAIDTTGVQNLSYALSSTNYLSDFASNWNTASATNMQSMFKGALNISNTIITKIGQWDTSNVTDMSQMFQITGSGTRHSIVTAPSLNTASVTTMSEMFSSSNVSNGYLRTVPQYNCSSVTNVYNMFYKQSDLADLGGFTNLGKAFNSSDPATYHTLDLSASSNLTKQSIMNVINNLAAPDDTLVSDATLKLNSTRYNLLDASDIAIATAKNWSVISA